jgi:Flp pilus assembly protein TadD
MRWIARGLAPFLLVAGMMYAPVAEASANEAEVRYRTALQHKREGRIAEALTEAREAVRLFPGHSRAHSLVGTLLYRQQQYDAALAAFRQALHLNPELSEAAAMAGATLVRLKRHKEAVPVLQRAVRLDPADAQSWGNLGVALRKLGKNVESMRA